MSQMTEATPRTNGSDGEPALSESQIAVHWREEEYVLPPKSFVEQANASDEAILQRFAEPRFPDCFVEYADMLQWDRKWDTVLDASNQGLPAIHLKGTDVSEAYRDVVARFAGEQRALRFTDAARPGFFKRMFGAR